MESNHFSDIVWYCDYHLVFVPRNKAVGAFCILEQELEKILIDICGRLEAGVLLLETNPNHVHIRLSISPWNSLSEVIQNLKSMSSDELFRRYSGLLPALDGKSFWTDGCLLCTKKLSKQRIQDYIDKQLEADWQAEPSCN